MEDVIQIVEFSTFFAVIPVYAAVQLIDLFAASGLMKSVDVLGHHCQQLPLPLPFRQLFVGGVGLCAGAEHLRPVKAEKFFGIAFIKRMA